jgi:hypothetical protein
MSNELLLHQLINQLVLRIPLVNEYFDSIKGLTCLSSLNNDY